jgi:hypothetical protein
MLKTTVKYVDGVRFIDKVRFLDMDERRHGIPVHYVDDELLRNTDGLETVLKLHGLWKVDFAYERKASIYTHGWVNFVVFKIVDAVFTLYWPTIRWLYDNARIFKQIPTGTMFSWRYFTPYVWFKGLPK